MKHQLRQATLDPQVPVVDPSVLFEATTAALLVIGPGGPVAANHAFGALTGGAAEDIHRPAALNA